MIAVSFSNPVNDSALSNRNVCHLSELEVEHTLENWETLNFMKPRRDKMRAKLNGFSRNNDISVNNSK